MCLDAPFGRIEQCAHGHLMCAEDDPQSRNIYDDEHGPCATRVRAAAGGARCPMCRIALPPLANAIRALSAEQGIAALPWAGPYTRPLLNFTLEFSLLLQCNYTTHSSVPPLQHSFPPELNLHIQLQHACACNHWSHPT